MKKARANVKVTYKGKPFKMYKFRTMILNSDELLPEVERTHGRNARGNIINDPRFTRIGKFFKMSEIFHQFLTGGWKPSAFLFVENF